MAGLQKALAGKSSGPKRKAPGSDSDSGESQEWAQWALHLHSSNKLPGTVAKKNIEKANKAGATSLKIQSKKGKKKCSQDFEENVAQDSLAHIVLGTGSHQMQKNKCKDFGGIPFPAAP